VSPTAPPSRPRSPARTRRPAQGRDERGGCPSQLALPEPRGTARLSACAVLPTHDETGSLIARPRSSSTDLKRPLAFASTRMPGGFGELHPDVAGAFDRLRLRRRSGLADVTEGPTTKKLRPATEDSRAGLLSRGERARRDAARRKCETARLRRDCSRSTHPAKAAQQSGRVHKRGRRRAYRAMPPVQANRHRLMLLTAGGNL
jgi:hypothetical protein